MFPIKYFNNTHVVIYYIKDVVLPVSTIASELSLFCKV